AALFRSRHPRRHDCLLDLGRIADRTADEPALDLTVVGRRVRKPALECMPLVARQRVADHSEPRIAWRGRAIGPIISNRRPSWSKRIFARAAVTFGTIDQRFAAFSGESLMASVPMCRKIPTCAPARARLASLSSRVIAANSRSRLISRMLVIENLSTVMQLLAFKAARLSAFSGFRQRGTRRRTIASTFRETEEGSPLRGSSSATVTSRTRARAIARALFPGALVLRRSIIHATHAATGHGRHRCLFLRSLGDHRLSGDEQPCNRGCILQRGADHLGRINDP